MASPARRSVVVLVDWIGESQWRTTTRGIVVGIVACSNGQVNWTAALTVRSKALIAGRCHVA